MFCRGRDSNLFGRASNLAGCGTLVLALASACGAEPAPDNETKGGAAGLSGAGGTASSSVGGASWPEGLAGEGGSGGSRDGEAGAPETGGQNACGGEPGMAGGVGGETGMAGSGGEAGAGGSGGEAGAGGSGDDAGVCVEPLPPEQTPSGGRYGTVLPTLNATCYSKGGVYTAHYFELAEPTWVRFGLRHDLITGRNEYGVLSSGCTGEGSIIADLLYCRSNAIKLPAGTYSWGGCGLDADPYNRYIRFGETPSPPTNIDCDSAAKLGASTNGPVFDSTPRYYSFTYDPSSPEILPDLGADWSGGGTLHVEVVDGCSVNAVTYDTFDLDLCSHDAHQLPALDDRVYYLKVSGWDLGAHWTLSRF